ncbi:MAG: hypothetical protein IKD66_00650 [Solobacterium sp.]|nr:hypothetical protein [Solobacterium sp.]
MTIETLEEYRGIASGVEAIEMEIQTLYNPISSPNGREMQGSFSGSPSDPTAHAAMRIISLREKLDEERERMYATLEDIERWLITCEDPEIVSIIRWHYLLGLDWRQTNKKVYGYPDYWRSRKKIVRFFEKK